MDARTGPEGGSFEQISFALLLIRALDKRWSGALSVQPPSGEAHVIQLDRGLVSRVLVPDGFARLGDIVVEAGVVMEPELELALDGGGLLGQALAKARLIDAKTLQRALVLQLLKRLVRLFDFDADTRFVFRPGDESPFEGMPEGVRIDTLRVLWAGLSAHGEMGTWLTSTLRRIGESPFRIRADVNLRRFGFTGDARDVVRRIRDDQWTVRELSERCDGSIVERIVYLLAITRHLDFAPAGDSETLNGFQIEDESTTQDPISSDRQEPISQSSERTLRAAADDTPDTADTGEHPTPGKGRQVARIKLRRRVARRADFQDEATAADSSRAEPSSERPSSDRLDDRGSERPSARGSERPSSRGSERPSARPSSADQTLRSVSTRDQLSAEVRSRLSRLERETPYSLLDLEVDALDGLDEDDVIAVAWDALERASRRWDPDNCPVESVELEEGMAKVHEAMRRAFEILCDPQQRLLARSMAAAQRSVPLDSSRPVRFAASRQAAASPAPTPSSERDPSSNRAPPSSSDKEVPSGQRTAHATPAEFHERALMAFAEQDYEEALRLARQATSLAPNSPDYLAMTAWAHAHLDDPDLELIIFDFDDILERFPDHVTARYYRGSLLRRVGRHEAARVDFRQVLEVDPDHGGALRQLNKMGDSSTQAG